MSIKIIKERERVQVKEFCIDFDLIGDFPGNGFTFNTETWDGEPKFHSDYEDIQRKNYDYCNAHPELYERIPRVKTWSYIENAVGKCICGNEVELYDQYQGACECPECGRWYNLFGQELLNPEYWEHDEYDW